MVTETQTKIVQLLLTPTTAMQKLTSVAVPAKTSDSNAKATTVWRGEDITLSAFKVGQSVAVTVKLPPADFSLKNAERARFGFFGPLQIAEASNELVAHSLSLLEDKSGVTK